MRSVLMALVALAICTASFAAAPEWIGQIGVDANSYMGGGNDPFNYFAAYDACSDDYPDAWDTVNPAAQPHCLDLIFRGDQNGNNPTYPTDGLFWDFREPYDGKFKVWKIEAILPDEGETYNLVYNYDGFGGYPLPNGWICKLDMNGEINSGNYTSLSLYEVDLDHKSGTILTGLVQTGTPQTWYVIAGVPEPAFAQLAGLLVGVAGIGLVRFRK